MTILGIGIDLVEVHRIREALHQHPKIAPKLFTDLEMKSCQGRAYQFEELAGRFAAKEAMLKALGIGWRRGVKFNEIEIQNEASGKPCLRVCGRVKEFADKLGVGDIFLTISHTKSTATAQVVLVK